jgi:hypothetical protein
MKREGERGSDVEMYSAGASARKKEERYEGEGGGGRGRGGTIMRE